MEKLVYQGQSIPEYAPAAFEAAMKKAHCLVIREMRDTAQTSGIYAFDGVAVKYECSADQVTITLFGPEAKLGEVERIVLGIKMETTRD